MDAFVIVLISVLVITELHFNNAIPVPKLSVKLLCELLCEHCNGVSNMESGHCNCEVPEAHFKDNYACLERVQISAAEMNLKLTHFKNTRPKRSVSDLLGRINSKTSEDTLINYSEGFNKIPDQLFTPVTPDPTYMDKSEYQIPEHREILVKRSVNTVPCPEQERYEEKSTDNELVKKPSINYFQDSSPREEWYSKKSIIPSPVFSESKLRTPKLTVPVLHPNRKKRSHTEREAVSEKEDETLLRRKKANLNGNYAVKVNVNVEIPVMKWNQASKEKSGNSKFEVNDDLEPQVSLSLVPDESSILPSGASSLKPSTVGKKSDNTKSLVSNGPMDESSASTPVSNKFRSSADGNIENTGPRVANKLKGLFDESNSLFPETKPELLCPLKLPTLPTLPPLIPLSKFRAANEELILQQNEQLNNIKSRLEKLLARDQSGTSLQDLLQRNGLLKVPKSSIVMAKNTPLAKLGVLNSLPDCSPLKNRKLGDILTKGTGSNMKLNDQIEGMTLLEKIKDDQLKLKQSILRRLAQSRAKIGNQFENENSGLPLKVYPLFPVEPKARENTVDCDDYENNYINALPKPSIDKSRSKSTKTENVDEKLLLDSPAILPVTVIPTDDAIVSTTLTNEPTDKKFTNTVNERKDITTISQSSEPPKHKNDSIKYTTQLEVTEESTQVSTTDSTPAHTDNLSLDSNGNDGPDLQQQKQLLETTSEKFPLITSSPEAAFVTSREPISVLGSQSTESKDSSPSSNDNNMDATHPLSKHPHFVNHYENPNYFPLVFMQPAPGNNIRLSPEDTYRAMFDPALYRNDMQQMNYPPLFVRNDYPYPEQVPVLNSPMVYPPYPALPFDHPGRLMNNGAPDHLNHPLPKEHNGMLMRAYVPAEYFSNNPENVPSSNMFVLKPLQAPNGNVPYQEMIEHIQNGNAVIEILPVNLKDISSPRM